WVVAGAWCYLLVPIGGILAAIAIPAYQDYVTRAQLIQSVSMIQSLEAQTANYHQVNGKWPASLQDIGTPQPADKGIIEAIDFDNDGTIHASFRGSVWVRGKSLSMSPVTDANGEMTWNCSTDLPRRFLPLSMRDSCAEAVSQ
ncbi:MAG TPA: pilin, partial [Gammaproteobacteria bacterium]